MPRALFTAASGMQVQQTNIDNIANNLANASTAGFKRSRVEFQDILYQNLRSSGAQSSTSTNLPVGLQVGLGARAVSTERIFSQGDFEQSNINIVEELVQMIVAQRAYETNSNVVKSADEMMQIMNNVR